MKNAISDFAALDHLFRQNDRRDAAIIVTNHVYDARFLHRAHHFFRFIDISRERLLAQNRFARLRGCDRDLAVRVVRRADIDDVDLGIVNDATPVGLRIFPAEFRGRFFHSGAVASADCFHSHADRRIKKVRRLSPCVRVGFAHEIVADQTDGEGASGNHEQDLNSGRENSQECNFDGERLLDIAAEMVAQFLQAPNAVQNFGGGEALCQRSSFLFGRRQVPAIYICACSQNIRPPLE